MQSRRKFLVIDDNPDSRFLLVKTLLRKFPDAVIQECQSTEPAIDVMKHDALAAVVLHRATDADGEMLIKLLRRVNAKTPIVMVSGFDRSQTALAAGATAFLNYDEWLRIGTLVSELLAPPAASANTPPQFPARESGPGGAMTERA